MPIMQPIQEQSSLRRVQLAMPRVLPSPHSVGVSAQTPGSWSSGGHQPVSGSTQAPGNTNESENVI